LGILIFTDNPGVTETRLVLGEARARGIPTGLIAPWDVSMPGVPEVDADLVYVPSNMLNRGSTFELIHRLLILQELERQIGTVINPVESMLRYSKEHLTLQMSRLGLPHPRTLVTENVERAYEFAAGLLDQGRNVVLKPLCRGRGVEETSSSSWPGTPGPTPRASSTSRSSSPTRDTTSGAWSSTARWSAGRSDPIPRTSGTT